MPVVYPHAAQNALDPFSTARPDPPNPTGPPRRCPARPCRPPRLGLRGGAGPLLRGTGRGGHTGESDQGAGRQSPHVLRSGRHRRGAPSEFLSSALLPVMAAVGDAHREGPLTLGEKPGAPRLFSCPSHHHAGSDRPEGPILESERNLDLAGNGGCRQGLRRAAPNVHRLPNPQHPVTD